MNVLDRRTFLSGALAAPLLSPRLSVAGDSLACDCFLERARLLHHHTFVADLHADPLMQNRNLNQRWTARDNVQVDFPRLRETGYNLQIMGLPTSGPGGRLVFGRSTARKGWPLWARRLGQKNTFQSASFMIGNLHRYICASGGSVALVRTPLELDDNYKNGILSTMLSIEGGQCLAGCIKNLDFFYQRGVRCIGLAHYTPNDLGGATWRIRDRRRGLTPFGAQVVKRANDLGMVVDICHSSERAIQQILAISRAPVILSHTGVDGVKPMWRNISDKAICETAARGGVIGIIFLESFMAGESVEDVVDQIMYVINMVGPEHVAYGSDFLGGVSRLVRPMEDVTDTPRITAALLRRGVPESALTLILGENFRRVYHQAWEARCG